MRGGGAAIFYGQTVRKVGIDDQPPAGKLDHEAGLAKPRERESGRRRAGQGFRQRRVEERFRQPAGHQGHRIQGRNEVQGGDAGGAIDAFGGEAANVAGGDHARMRRQRQRGRRLLVEDVGRIGGHPAAVERLDQRLLVHQQGARGC